ncbi:hypothetical protein DFH09DRAFT_1328828 [Mycena vulgaris]|nr:hypothetical protein DFH09DRAFT_1328828 [Mycena vulgaris]
MTALDETSDPYDDPGFLAALANLDLEDSPPTPEFLLVPLPPRTPSSQSAPPYSSRHTFPSNHSRTDTTPHHQPHSDSTVYFYTTPTRRGYTADWSVAGTATQGIPHANVHAVHRPSTSKRKTLKKKAVYIVFCGRHPAVCYTWDETSALVSGVSNSIFHGYATVAEAHAALAYARAKHWTRSSSDSPAPAAIPHLPLPLPSLDSANPLNGSEVWDSRWYVVYRGITPGVYRSHLESQRNTLGIRGSLHESVEGKAAALAKYAAAARRDEVASVAPLYRADDRDLFL